jgi:hypothetical protein
MGNLIHHDAITGTALEWVTNDFNDKSKIFKAKVFDMHSNYLTEKI